MVSSETTNIEIKNEMVRLGTKKRPIVARVQSNETAEYVVETCTENGWHCIIGLEPDKPEDLSDLEKMLNPPKQAISKKIGRNEPCPCGSRKKYKKCCGSSGP